jgi:hypothetical protein
MAYTGPISGDGRAGKWSTFVLPHPLLLLRPPAFQDAVALVSAFIHAEKGLREK